MGCHSYNTTKYSRTAQVTSCC